MTATSVVCPDCGSPVAPGRLSCQSCGTLLASVVGSSRREPWAATPASLPEIDEDRPLASARPPEPALTPEPVSAAPVEAPPAPKRGPRRLTRPKAPSAPAAPAKARYVKSAPADPMPPIDQTALFGPVPTVAPPILQSWSEQVPATNGSAGVDHEPVPSRATAAAATTATAGTVAGSYLAPSATYVAPVTPRPPQAPAWPGATRSVPPVPASDGNGASSSIARGVTASPTADAEAVGSRRLTDWLTIGGSVLVIVSFFLPWATDGVIGSRGQGFTADWGLANPGHLLMIAAAAAVLILHVVQNPVPVWFRSGALPLLVGGILAGLAFAYYARPAGGGAGVAVLLAGALVLIGGGILACRPERHGTGASRV